MPLREHLIDALKRHLASGKPARLPEGGSILWSAFSDLSSARTVSMAGPNPISYGEIAAWCQLNRYPLALHHVAILRGMDATWLDHAYRDRPTSPNALPRSSGQAISAAAFDAVFG